MMVKGDVRIKCRTMLENLKVGQTLVFPARHKDTVYQERIDLRLFHGYEFRGSYDRNLNKMKVTRTK